MIFALLAGGLLVGWTRLGHLARAMTTKQPSLNSLEYFDSVSLELRRGASLRQALALAAPRSRLAMLALTGQPLPELAAEVERSLSAPDPLVVPGVRLAGDTGAPAAALFSHLADRARRTEQLARDLHSATVQARMSAAVVGAIPLLLGSASLLGGRTELFTAPGPVRAAVLVGLALQLVGVAVIASLLRRSR